MTSPEPEPTEYGLVMPFVTVTSNGGPHDDHAYTAGFEMGSLHARLAVVGLVGGDVVVQAIRTENVPQADLVAMRHGFILAATPSGVDGWTDATFTRATSPEEP